MTKVVSTQVGFYDRHAYTWEPFSFHGSNDDTIQDFHKHVSRNVHHRASTALVATAFRGDCLVDLLWRIRESYNQI